MIRDFSVQNFLSIRDKQELSFIAKGPESPIVKRMGDGAFVYKLGVFFGSNASGKSNMMAAINEVFRILACSKAVASERISGYVPFELSKDRPTVMAVSFYADGIRYDYEVVFDGRNIISEELNYYPNRSKSLFYSRRFMGDNVQAEIKFGSSLHISQKTQRSIRENTLNNHSVLAVCGKFSFEEDINVLSRLYKWVRVHYHVDDSSYSRRGVVEILRGAFADSRRHRFFKIMLNKADLNISDFNMVVEDRYIPDAMRNAVEQGDFAFSVKEDMLAPVVNSVVFENCSDDGSFRLPVKLQSKGTIKFIQILDALYDLISGSNVYCLDELGEDLHHDLMMYYLSVFLYNSDDSQLLITSQERDLLNQDILNDNRGAVWFVDKNRCSASSEYNRADSFGLHKNLSLYNSYCIGRMGANPQLGSFFINLED